MSYDRTKFCPVCATAKAYPLQEGEVQIGFDIEPIADDYQRQLFLNVFLKIIPPLILDQKVCLHGARFNFRGTHAEREAFGLTVRAYDELDCTRLSLLADIFLEQGAFHPSRLVEVPHEEL